MESGYCRGQRQSLRDVVIAVLHLEWTGSAQSPLTLAGNYERIAIKPSHACHNTYELCIPSKTLAGTGQLLVMSEQPLLFGPPHEPSTATLSEALPQASLESLRSEYCC